jgi:hypothetical protein
MFSAKGFRRIKCKLLDRIKTKKGGYKILKAPKGLIAPSGA